MPVSWKAYPYELVLSGYVRRTSHVSAPKEAVGVTRENWSETLYTGIQTYTPQTDTVRDATRADTNGIRTGSLVRRRYIQHMQAARRHGRRTDEGAYLRRTLSIQLSAPRRRGRRGRGLAASLVVGPDEARRHQAERPLQLVEQAASLRAERGRRRLDHGEGALAHAHREALAQPPRAAAGVALVRRRASRDAGEELVVRRAPPPRHAEAAVRAPRKERKRVTRVNTKRVHNMWPAIIVGKTSSS